MGARFDLRLSNLPTNPALGAPILITGLQNTAWNGLPLPVPLDALGAPGCSVHVSVDRSDLVPNLGGYTDASVYIPIEPALNGFELFFQGAFLAPVNAFGLVTSHGMSMRIGQ